MVTIGTMELISIVIMRGGWIINIGGESIRKSR